VRITTFTLTFAGPSCIAEGFAFNACFAMYTIDARAWCFAHGSTQITPRCVMYWRLLSSTNMCFACVCAKHVASANNLSVIGHHVSLELINTMPG
jgi:hypothetical protein